MGHRYAGRQAPTPRRSPGDDLDGDAVGEAVQRLAATAEDEGVAALEADHPPAPVGVLDEQGVDPALWHGVMTGGLPDVDDLDLRRELGRTLVDRAGR